MYGHYWGCPNYPFLFGSTKSITTRCILMIKRILKIANIKLFDWQMLPETWFQPMKNKCPYKRYLSVLKNTQETFWHTIVSFNQTLFPLAQFISVSNSIQTEAFLVFSLRTPEIRNYFSAIPAKQKIVSCTKTTDPGKWTIHNRKFLLQFV